MTTRTQKYRILRQTKNHGLCKTILGVIYPNFEDATEASEAMIKNSSVFTYKPVPLEFTLSDYYKQSLV